MIRRFNARFDHIWAIFIWKKDKIVVPQGGSLSLILFLIYIDGLGVLRKILGLDFIIYADDLCLTMVGKVGDGKKEWLQIAISRAKF